MTITVLKAIEKARPNFKELKRSGENSFFKSNGVSHRYSTLTDIFDACYSALLAENLTIVYQIKTDGHENRTDNIIVTKIVNLETQETLQSESTLGTHNVKTQETGSAITYLRRYHLQCLLNLEADFEDDGNIASKNNSKDITKIVDKESLVIDYDYLGSPYRVFGKDGNMKQTFTDVKSWGLLIKTMPERNTEANIKEIARIKNGVENDTTMSEKVKENLLNSIGQLNGGNNG
tara:strand:- start:297 stop:998 length:702 start_codon:yes stop_codon:yes gene_type:complete